MTEKGRRFAYRERAHTPEDPVRPVELVKEGPPRSQKVKVRWLDDEYEGLEEWVPRVRLRAPWEETEAFLEDERRMLAAVEFSKEVSDEVRWEAAGEVFGALSENPTPQEEILLGYRTVENDLLFAQDLSAAASRLGLSRKEMLAEPHAFVDRSGSYRAPFQTALEVAKHLCRGFPREVLGRIQEIEDELREELVTGGPAPAYGWWTDGARREYAEKRLRELEPVHTLIRQWCGQEAREEFDHVLTLQEEVDRLRNLVLETAWWLKHNGHPVKAGLLRRKLDELSDRDQVHQPRR